MSQMPPISLDIDAWKKFHDAMRDRLIGDLALAKGDLRAIPEGDPAYSAATWNATHVTQVLRLLDVTDLMVKKLAEDQPLLDFVKKLREAHESEERTREGLR